MPIQRYLSLALLNRITFFEFDQLCKSFPAVMNNLTADALYDANIGSEPPRNMEVVQSWEAVKALNARLVDTDTVCITLLKAQSCVSINSFSPLGIVEK